MDVKQLLAQFAPFCCFHKMETSFPINFTNYLANSDLIVENEEGHLILPERYKNLLNTHSPHQILEEWLVDNESLRASYRNAKLLLSPHVDAPGMQGDFDPVSATLHSLPMHSLAAEVTLKNAQGEPDMFYRLTYLFLYRDNIPAYAFGAGKHLGDIEHVTIYVPRHEDGSWDNQIHKMYYAAHSSLEGTWLNGNEINYRDGHPISYIARGSHADYPSLNLGRAYFSSTHYVPRVFSFASDQIDDDGINYQITRDDLLPLPASIRNGYEIDIGGIEGGGTLNKDYIHGPEATLNTNNLVRQLPTKVELGRWTFWNPENHLSKLTHDEQVGRLLDEDLADSSCLP